MLTKDAVFRVLSTEGISKYRLAKEIGVQPIMIDNYLDHGTRMGVATAKKFTEVYAIEVDDIFNNRKAVDVDG